MLRAGPRAPCLVLALCATLSGAGCTCARRDVRALDILAGLGEFLRAPGALPPALPWGGTLVVLPCEASLLFILLMRSLVRVYSAPAAALAAIAAGLRAPAGPVATAPHTCNDVATPLPLLPCALPPLDALPASLPAAEAAEGPREHCGWLVLPAAARIAEVMLPALGRSCSALVAPSSLERARALAAAA